MYESFPNAAHPNHIFLSTWLSLLRSPFLSPVVNAHIYKRFPVFSVPLIVICMCCELNTFVSFRFILSPIYFAPFSKSNSIWIRSSPFSAIRTTSFANLKWESLSQLMSTPTSVQFVKESYYRIKRSVLVILYRLALLLCGWVFCTKFSWSPIVTMAFW